MTTQGSGGHDDAPESAPSGTDDVVVQAAESAHAALLDLAKRDPVLAGQLARLVAVVASEAARSGRLARSLTSALAVPEAPASGRPVAPKGSRTDGRQAPRQTGQTRLNRRKPGPWDPFEVFASVGPDGLRTRLMQLDLEELRDIIAEHGMDADKLAMKWKDTSRLVERIVERVGARSEKGSAFRGTG